MALRSDSGANDPALASAGGARVVPACDRVAPGLASRRRAEHRPGGDPADLGPAGPRPRRAGVPGRAVRARGVRDLERELVRGALHAHLQRPVPSARRAARPPARRRAVGDRFGLPVRPPRARPLGRARAVGDAVVRRRRGDDARDRPGDVLARRRLRARGPAGASARPHPAGDPRGGLGCALSSPVAAVFLAGIAASERWSRARAGDPRRARRRRGRGGADPAPQPRLPGREPPAVLVRRLPPGDPVSGRCVMYPDAGASPRSAASARS